MGGAVGYVALAWSRLAPRTIGLAEELGLQIVSYGDRFPYARAFMMTLKNSLDWRGVLLQLPPGPALVGSLIARGLRGFTLFCDVHTGMIWFRDWRQMMLNASFVSFLRLCDYVLAHNRDNASRLRSIGVRRVEIVYDPVPKRIQTKRPCIDVERFNYIVIPAGWDTDEPFDYLLEEVGKDVIKAFGTELVITGDYRRTSHGRKYFPLLSRVRGVVLTGYLQYEEYAWLIENSVAVLGLTNSEHIMLRAFWEAAAYARPVIAPETSVTREIMDDLPYYYTPYKKGSLRSAVARLVNDTDSEERGETLSARMKALSKESIARLKELMLIT